MIWECQSLRAQNSSNFSRVAIALASGKHTIDIRADNEDSAFDREEFVGHIGIDARPSPGDLYSGAYETMLASERVLRKDWEDPEEEAAWAHL